MTEQAGRDRSLQPLPSARPPSFAARRSHHPRPDDKPIAQSERVLRLSLKARHVSSFSCPGPDCRHCRVAGDDILPAGRGWPPSLERGALGRLDRNPTKPGSLPARRQPVRNSPWRAAEVFCAPDGTPNSDLENVRHTPRGRPGLLAQLRSPWILRVSLPGCWQPGLPVVFPARQSEDRPGCRNCWK